MCFLCLVSLSCFSDSVWCLLHRRQVSLDIMSLNSVSDLYAFGRVYRWVDPTISFLTFSFSYCSCHSSPFFFNYALFNVTLGSAYILYRRKKGKGDNSIFFRYQNLQILHNTDLIVVSIVHSSCKVN